MVKTLIIYYSRTGTTKKIGDAIVSVLNHKVGEEDEDNCDTEEIIDTKNRSGAIGYLMAGKDATLKSTTKIEEVKKNPAVYDAVIIGTPVWAWNMSAAIRTYLVENKENLEKVPKIAFFCTMGGNGAEKAFKEMAGLLGRENLASIPTFVLKTKDALNGFTEEGMMKLDFKEKVKKFVGSLR